jgi:hypothetical protein
MSSNDTRGLVLRLCRTVALLGIVAASLVCAGVASAVDDDPDKDPPPGAGAPNLVFTANSVEPFGTSQWEIRYTVRNQGITATPAFHVAVQENGGGLIKDTAQASLQPGFSRSEIIHVARTGCYFAVRFVADSTRVVRESSENDNERVALNMTSPTCPQLPKYKVRAMSFYALDETGPDSPGANEPYWVTNVVGEDGTASTKASHVFGSIDTGDTASFGLTEGCLYLSCSGGPAPFGIGFSIQLWEQERNDVAEILRKIADEFGKAGPLTSLTSASPWVATATPIIGGALKLIADLAEDDLIGSQTYAYSPQLLAAKLPAVGSSLTDVRRYEDGTPILGGAYELTTVVTRVA